MGEGLQWFYSTIADLPGGGEVCNGGKGLQYNNGTWMCRRTEEEVVPTVEILTP